MDPSLIHDLTAAYALDALDPDEKREYEEHLRHCDNCRKGLKELQETASALAYAAPADEPSPELRERLLAQAAADRPTAQVIPFRRRVAVPALAATAAAAAAAAITLAIWASSLSGSLDEERQARADEAAVLALVASTDASRVPLSGAEGTLVIAANGDAALVVTGLPEAPSDQTYEVWVIEGEARPAGLFSGGDETAVLLTERVSPGATVAVTLERAGGVPAPTSDPLLTATVS